MFMAFPFFLYSLFTIYFTALSCAFLTGRHQSRNHRRTWRSDCCFVWSRTWMFVNHSLTTLFRAKELIIKFCSTAQANKLCLQNMQALMHWKTAIHEKVFHKLVEYRLSKIRKRKTIQYAFDMHHAHIQKNRTDDFVHDGNCWLDWRQCSNPPIPE